MPDGTRIGGGALKGRRVRVPEGIRPTTLRTRQILFDMWMTEVPGALFLDLFAGGGAVALEAISRGAERAVLVEESRAALALLRRNCGDLAPSRTLPVEGSLPDCLPSLVERFGAGFDLLFADPPYGFPDYRTLLEGMGGLCQPRGEAAIEHSRRVEIPAEAGVMRRHRVRTHGDTSLSFYRCRKSEGDPRSETDQ